MGKRVGNYYIDKKIGSGAFGKVRLGTNLSTNEVFAVKIVDLDGLKPKVKQLLEQEINLLQQCDCPYVIKLQEVLKSKRNYYLVMEYCEGGDVSNVIKENGPTPELIAKKWTRQLISALVYLKRNNIIHRDLKPANLLLTDQNLQLADIKIADFGFARILHDNCLASTHLGSPLFMAPEVLREERYDFKADVWSLGTIIYEILFGKPVFECYSRVDLMNLQKRPISFPEDVPVSDNAKNLIIAMMKYNSNQRVDLENLLNHPFLFDDIPDINCRIAQPYPSHNEIIQEVLDTERSSFEDEDEAEEYADLEDIEETEECSTYSDFTIMERSEEIKASESPAQEDPLPKSIKRSFGSEPNVQATQIDFEISELHEFEKLIENFEEESLEDLAFAISKYTREKYEHYFEKIEKLKKKFRLPYLGNQKFYEIHKKLKRKVDESREKENELRGFVCDYSQKRVAQEMMCESLRLIEDHTKPKLKSALLLLIASKATDPEDDRIENSLCFVQELYQKELQRN